VLKMSNVMDNFFIDTIFVDPRLTRGGGSF